MLVDFPFENLCGKTVAVALSGGSDSMALLFFLKHLSASYAFSVKALNVEHGIRGEESLADTAFVRNYCKDNGVELISYSVNCPDHAKKNKLSIEESARILRYGCFSDAVDKGLCDYVATAHHSKDSVETALFNLFRGSGVKGLTGIKQKTDYIIRPFIHTSKEDINKYIELNNIPYVTDSTNECTDYTRNYIRKNILPKIYEVFPEAERSVERFFEIAAVEDEYLDKQAKNALLISDDGIKIKTDTEKAVFGRAFILALKKLGVEKDWEKKHVDYAFALCSAENGKKINLPFGIDVYKEYGYIFLTRRREEQPTAQPFGEGDFIFGGAEYSVKTALSVTNLKDGFYIDKDKIPDEAVIRSKQDGDLFTKFGGKTKSLSDYFTDTKIERRKRNFIPLITCGNTVYAIFGLAVSDLAKVDDKTTTVYKLTKKD